MKKLFIAAFVSLALGNFAFAGEEIQLAAAIGAGASATVPEPAADTAEPGSAASSAAALGTGSMVAIGALAAGVIAALASSGGGSSTSSH